MRFTTLVSSLTVGAALVRAQGQNQVIHVGIDESSKTGLFFSPNSLKANVNDTVTFVFNAVGTNHSVTQSTFAAPCDQVDNGFSSGFVPVPAGTTDNFPNYTITVTAATPIWFYCAQQAKDPKHCTAGMVGAINAPEGDGANNFEKYLAAASTQTTIEAQTAALTGVGAFATAEPVLLPPSNGTAPPTNSGGSQSNGASPTTGGNNTAPGQTNTPGAASAVKLDGVLALVAAAFGIALF